MCRPKKDSGVEWIGEIPSDWDVIIAKRLFRKEKRPITNDEIVTAFRDGEVTQRKNRRTTGFTMAEKEIGYQGVEPGDLVIHAMDAFAGAIGVSDSPGKCSPVCSICTPIVEDNTHYYAYLLRMYADLGYIESMAKGIRERSTDFRYATFAITPLIKPSIMEQERIVKFIDKKITHIDSIIEKTEASIDAFKRYKQALVTETVTKGLNPDVPLKDSGIEWIGMIPEHWKLYKTKALFEIKKVIAKELGHDVLSITQSGLKVKDLSTNEGQISSDYSKYQLVNIGDFAMNHMDLLTGWIDLAKMKGVTSPDYRVFRKKENIQIYNSYYKYIFQACYSNKIYYGLGQGVSHLGRWRLQTDAFLNFYLPFPSVNEQQQIAAILDKKTGHIDSLIQTKEEMVKKLEEYKKSLIYEYVTGKKEVN